MYKTLIKEESKINKKKQVWEAYFAAPNEENTNAVFQAYAYLVKTTAVRLKTFLGETASLDELLESGITGLIEAVHKYTAGNRVPFESYATQRVKRSMLNAVGKKGPIQQKLTSTKKRIDGVREDLRTKTGKRPDDIEVAHALDMTLTALIEAEEAFSLSQATSFDNYIEENVRIAKAPEAAKPKPFNKTELAGRLASSMSLLTKEEQKVILMFYYEDLTQHEISQVLEISEDQVAELHVSAMGKMQSEMLEYMDIFVNAL